jgi:hypothetical protein
MIVDAALFEPGRWKPADSFTDVVDEIPIKDFNRLKGSTCNLLDLFN